MNPPESPHKNVPGAAELWAAAADVLTSVPHFSQLGWKAGLDFAAIEFSTTATPWPGGRLLSGQRGWAFGVCQHRSGWHQLPLLALCWQPEQPCKSHEEQPVLSPAKAFVACILNACHWKFASSGTLRGIFGPGVGRVFALQRTLLLGHAAIHLCI